MIIVVIGAKKSQNVRKFLKIKKFVKKSKIWEIEYSHEHKILKISTIVK